MAEALKTFSFPVGGIADFYLEDHEKEALYREKAQENFGTDGLGAIQDVAVRMASYGRYGDDKLVHAETGELVVPKALIEKNPKLKDSIFNHLKDMGIEDPERYVVGTEANSINPDTGLPEFFLKDIFDKVGDVIRKVAKPVLTIAGTAIFGPIYGAALGAGIGGLIQGESLEQAFGSALTAGATGGALSFLGGAGSALVKGANPITGGLGSLQEAAKLSNITQGFSDPFYQRAMTGPAETAPSGGAGGTGEQSTLSKIMFGEKPSAEEAVTQQQIDAMNVEKKDVDMETGGQGPAGQDAYAMLRARLPQEVPDDVVKLIAYNKEAFADFASIKNQEDVTSFNQKYNVSMNIDVSTV